MHNQLPSEDRLLAGIVVVIPSRAPGPELLSLVEEIQAHGLGTLVVVDDGSGPEFDHVFASIAHRPGAHLLHHAVNLGKGRALKTAFNYVLTELHDVSGVVTADSDGQHAAADIAAVARTMISTAASRVVLGTRSFGGSVPWRSRFGNRITRILFRLFTGVQVTDTQCGLRALPLTVLPELLLLECERYEYEMTVLTHLCRRGVRPVELPIATIYLDGNCASHFDPICDSMRICFALLAD